MVLGLPQLCRCVSQAAGGLQQALELLGPSEVLLWLLVCAPAAQNTRIWSAFGSEARTDGAAGAPWLPAML